MIFMLTVWYPPTQSTAVAGIYMERPREIPFIRKWQVFNTSGGKKGNKQYHLIMSERGEGQQALIEINKYMLPLANEIKGLRTKIEVLMGVTDSMKLVGMDWE